MCPGKGELCFVCHTPPTGSGEAASQPPGTVHSLRGGRCVSAVSPRLSFPPPSGLRLRETGLAGDPLLLDPRRLLCLQAQVQALREAPQACPKRFSPAGRPPVPRTRLGPSCVYIAGQTLWGKGSAVCEFSSLFACLSCCRELLEGVPRCVPAWSCVHIEDQVLPE